jgi:hypothetical protein
MDKSQETFTWDIVPYKEKALFTVYPKDTRWDNKSYIYIVARLLPPPVLLSESYTPIYIDIADNMTECFKNHKLLECFKKHGWTHVQIMSDLSAVDIKRIKDGVLSNYDFPCNT